MPIMLVLGCGVRPGGGKLLNPARLQGPLSLRPTESLGGKVPPSLHSQTRFKVNHLPNLQFLFCTRTT